MLMIVEPIMRLIEVPMKFLQDKLRLKNPAWLFLFPNLVLFGLFAFLPILVNVAYAVTGSDAILLADRPYVGATNFTALMDCDSYLDPNSCRDDLFWRAVHNTFKFTVLQVALMVTFSLITALILNRDIRARGFFRSVFFSRSCCPPLLSP